MSSTRMESPAATVPKAEPRTMENAPWSRIHTLAVFCTLGGTFLDGYILGIVGGAIPPATQEMHLNLVSQGLIGASALIGIFVGGLCFGRLADRFGRRTVFQWNLFAFVALSLLQLLAVSQWDLVAYRLLLGIAIGVEYAVGAALLSEFVPAKRRSHMLGALNAVWFVGFVPATLISLHWAEANWRIVLATSAIPAIIVALLRMGLPESPKWLVSQGRNKQAREILDKHWPADTELPEIERVEQGRFRELFTPKYLAHTIYASMFWICQVAPVFAILTFIAPVLTQVGIPEGDARDLIMNLFELVGAVVFVWILAASKRRTLVIWTFAVVSLGLAFVGLFTHAPIYLLAVAIGVVLFVSAGSNNLQFVYPSEMFPTKMRSSGVGFAASMSRLGAATATYIMPLAMAGMGISGTLLLLAAFPAVGFVISLFMAPETSGTVIK